jgi:hypothetical protein
MSSWLRRLLWLDVAVCSAFLFQLLFFPGHFLEASFGEPHGASSPAALRDMTRLLAGIYASWTLILMWLTVVPSRALAGVLLVSAVVQLPIAWSLEAVTSSFRTTNVVMLSFWCVSYATLFVAWPRQ